MTWAGAAITLIGIAVGCYWVYRNAQSSRLVGELKAANPRARFDLKREAELAGRNAAALNWEMKKTAVLVTWLALMVLGLALVVASRLIS